MSSELQEMRDHIMSMDAHDLRDAVMDPMMLGNSPYNVRYQYQNIFIIVHISLRLVSFYFNIIF